MKTWKTWTMRELARLEELRLAGLTAAEIAVALGRTFASVKCRLAEEGIQKPRSERWLRVLSVPHRIADVARTLGFTCWAVKQAKRKLRRAGFDIPAAIRGS